jgi:hypothetical protein
MWIGVINNPRFTRSKQRKINRHHTPPEGGSIGPGNKTTITALVAGLIGLGWFAAAQAIDLQWYGQSAVKITTDTGKVIVIDPFITKNPKTPEALKDLNKLGKVDLTLLTYGPGDTRKF